MGNQTPDPSLQNCFIWITTHVSYKCNCFVREACVLQLFQVTEHFIICTIPKHTLIQFLHFPIFWLLNFKQVHNPCIIVFWNLGIWCICLDTISVPNHPPNTYDIWLGALPARINDCVCHNTLYSKGQGFSRGMWLCRDGSHWWPSG